VPELDEKIRSQRTRTEERLISRARRAGVSAPTVWETGRSKIVMEFIEGPTVKECLNGMAKVHRLKVYSQIGKAAASLHKAGVMHGDLTTSNMILRGDEQEKSGKLYVIDFGLSRTSQRVEDHAVDLYLLYEALKAAHYRFLEESWKNIIKAYKYNYTIADKVLERLEKIEKRRRYRGE
ncbi:MAG: Kae1-associated serine/threonine protein kinase, partial [Candidatus Aenigmarchaeota archaeon]|nr:Kae1-associated serine/threonine protein kinase [Candidatus Aenigmarchaeota archaeon]